MPTLRIAAFLLAALLALPCSLPPSASAFGSIELDKSLPSQTEAEREKKKKRDELDQERAKAYQPAQPSAKPKKHQEIIIHTN